MDCKHAYLKNGIQYILCHHEPQPQPNDHRSLFHATCPFQVFCKTSNCHKMTPEWKGCAKIVSESRQNAARQIIEEPAPKPTPRRKPRKKPVVEAETATIEAESLETQE